MTVVQTALGEVRGAIAVTARADVQIFLGIPFAEAPVGEHRFLPPRPVKPWKGTFDATRFGPAAPQNRDPVLTAGGFFQPRTSEEDSLNLNIWTPRADDRRRPVMVWIHGGANVNGSNSARYTSGAELAATFDVVVVAINYRLGALGYLSLAGMVRGAESSGNNAVLDQVLALRWISDHIEQFGGDPNAVTVFGESAGAAAVGTLLGTPAAAGLFHRAIMQSGTAERVTSLEAAEQVTERFLAHAGLTRSVASRVRDLPVRGILAAQAEVQREFAASTIGLPMPFQSVIDGAILPTVPLEAIRAGASQTVDLLVGTNANEAAMFTARHPSRDARQNLDRLFAQYLPGGEQGYRQALHACSDREFDSSDVAESLLSDVLYRQPTNRLLAARANASGTNFAYFFAWRTPIEGGRLGACHALELPFVFRQLHRIESISLAGENPPHGLSEAMSAAWVRFADTGRPRSTRLPEWPGYEPDQRKTMVLDEFSYVALDPLGALRDFWAEAVMA